MSQKVKQKEKTKTKRFLLLNLTEEVNAFKLR